MANFYIDYENVHNEGLNGIENLTSADNIYLFYSDKADTLKIEVVQKIMATQGIIKFMKIENGVENALDFQLITALICDYSADNNYYIISRDKGYDAAISMAQKRDRKTIFRCRDINMALKHQNNEAIDESDQDVIIEINTDDEAVAGDLPALEAEAAVNADGSLAEQQVNAEEITDISGDEKSKRAYQSICTKILNTVKLNHKIMINYHEAEQIYKALQGSTTKMEFYHMLNKLMGRKDGSEVYKKVKAIYKVLRGIYKASVTAKELADGEAKAVDLANQPADVREINLEGVDCERDMIEIVMEALSEEALSGEDVEAEAAAIVTAVKLETAGQTVDASDEEKAVATEPDAEQDDSDNKAGKQTRRGRGARTKTAYSKGRSTNTRTKSTAGRNAATRAAGSHDENKRNSSTRDQGSRVTKYPRRGRPRKKPLETVEN